MTWWLLIDVNCYFKNTTFCLIPTKCTKGKENLGWRKRWVGWDGGRVWGSDFKYNFIMFIKMLHFKKNEDSLFSVCDGVPLHLYVWQEHWAKKEKMVIWRHFAVWRLELWEKRKLINKGGKWRVGNSVTCEAGPGLKKKNYKTTRGIAVLGSESLSMCVQQQKTARAAVWCLAGGGRREREKDAVWAG